MRSSPAWSTEQTEGLKELTVLSHSSVGQKIKVLKELAFTIACHGHLLCVSSYGVSSVQDCVLCLPFYFWGFCQFPCFEADSYSDWLPTSNPPTSGTPRTEITYVCHHTAQIFTLRYNTNHKSSCSEL
ncbi:Uncharacterised protein [Chlamydia trachomatis]|nr:Uncharacterised protein [Chlamydia trachomatis]